MKFIWVLAGGISLGFALGYVIRDATVIDAPSGTKDRTGKPAARPKSGDRDASERRSAEGRATRGNRAANRDRNEGRDGERGREKRTRSEALVAFRDSLESGDRGAMHDALRDLSRSGGEPLSGEELEDLGSLLREVDGHTLEELSRALVMSGGAEGVAMVLAFAGDSDLSLQARERALHGLSRVPREMADTILPSLADFLESGPPERLQHSAAHAIGNLFRDDATDTLLGLLADRPGISANAIFDAIGDTGRLKDTEALMSMLSGDLSGSDKMGLLKAVGRISTRQGDPELLR